MRNRVVIGLVGIVAMIVSALLPAYGQTKGRELVILTTFSREPLNALIVHFNQLYPDVEVRLIHRRTQSAIQLLNRRYMQDVDLVLSSSPFLMQKLATHSRLHSISWRTERPVWIEPFILPPKEQVAVLGYSGAGIVWNQDYLSANKLPVPKSFVALTDPIYFEHITMSTPSRSGTTQMMIESILHQYGWRDGWRIILNIGANLGTISARSFGVSDYVAKGQFGVGPTIDSYALILQQEFEHLRFSYDQDFTLMPTYIAEIASNSHDQYAAKFIQILLSSQVQTTLDKSSFSKHAMADKSLYSEKIPTINFTDVLGREQLVNKIFDMAVTKRLPMLKDSWLALHTVEKQLTNAEQLAELETLKALLFSVPFSEQEIESLANKLTMLNTQSELEKNQMEVLLAEFDHYLALELATSLVEVEDKLRQLKLEANL
ncbi:ABC transporter substrate-binding protein [Vibrio panuliri]|uniref:ABC transporter substrate-binding protein n=1 Tax=Vibrio panuliri TaxID=1381081 RepID=UPI000B155D49|nr:ABC transporter substrate-binding protein [Vibrio panuliri]